VLKFLLVVAVFAVATYLAIRFLQGQGPGGSRGGARLPRPKPKPKPVAPDDDEDFLRDLDRKRFHGEDETEQ
jgi:hypothetical protein